MNRPLVYVLFIATILVISVTCQPDSMLAPPGRPSEFRTPDQLRSYLKALNDYYAIVGRPRFGRSVNKKQMEKAYEDAVNNYFGDVWYDSMSRDSFDYMGDSNLPLYSMEE